MEVLWGEYEGTSMGSYEAELEGQGVCKKSKENGHLGLPNIKIFACGTCKGYVTAM